MQLRRILKRKKWFFNVPTILWWFIWELTKDSIMEATRDFFTRQGVAMEFLNYLLQHPGIIAFAVLLFVGIWAYVDTRKETQIKKDEQQDDLRIEVEHCNVLEFMPLPPNYFLEHMNIVEVKAKFRPLGKIKLHSLELHIGRHTFDAKRLPIIMIDHEDTYFINFEVPNKALKQILGKPYKTYVRAIFNDRDCRSNEFSIGLMYEPTDSESSDVLVPKRPSPELVIEIENYNFGFGGGGYPPKRFDDDNALWLRLGVTFKMNQTMRIETLYLLLSGDSIEPYDWSPDKSAYYFYFEMPKWVKPGGVRTIQLVAFAKGIKWGSEHKEIHITLPPQ